MYRRITTMLYLTTIFRIREELVRPKALVKMIYRLKWGLIWRIKGRDPKLSKISMRECRLLSRDRLHHQQWCFSSLYLSNYTQWLTFQQLPLFSQTREEYSLMLVEILSKVAASNSSRQVIRGFKQPSGPRASIKVSNISSSMATKIMDLNSSSSHRFSSNKCQLRAIRVWKVGLASNSSRWSIWATPRSKHSKTNNNLRPINLLTTSWRRSSPWHQPMRSHSYLKHRDSFKEAIKANRQ